MSQSAPTKIGKLPVKYWSPIDDRHRITGNCVHYDASAGREDPHPQFIAIVGGPESFYLIRFTSDWKFITDTWHASIEEAQRQAEFEYEGVSATWQMMGDSVPR